MSWDLDIYQCSELEKEGVDGTIFFKHKGAGWPKVLEARIYMANTGEGCGILTHMQRSKDQFY